MNNNMLEITLLGKHYQVKCPPENAELLKSAADYLNGKLDEIHKSTRAMSADRVAMMAALNICYELLAHKEKTSLNANDDLQQRLQACHDKIDSVLGG
ncbi:MAG: cell division protein ZapA [Pseudomonadota bacterium]